MLTWRVMPTPYERAVETLGDADAEMLVGGGLVGAVVLVGGVDVGGFVGGAVRVVGGLPVGVEVVGLVVVGSVGGFVRGGSVGGFVSSVVLGETVGIVGSPGRMLVV
ncbi:hypothetical protein [Streptodolium elevatio]|uniref:Uncharacterized protein n=1 Tax=Streptodolium elevatio TaxID=3157996 RepID=A0ABV3DSX2_9ACTN